MDILNFFQDLISLFRKYLFKSANITVLDQILIVLISSMILFLLAWLVKKLWLFIRWTFKSLFRVISDEIKLRRKGSPGFSINELIEIKKLPKEKLTRKQRKILDKGLEQEEKIRVHFKEKMSLEHFESIKNFKLPIVNPIDNIQQEVVDKHKILIDQFKGNKDQ